MTRAILLVDDDGPQRMLARICVEESAEGVADVIEAADAREGLSVVDKIPPNTPLLILCDYSMPGMDGVEMVQNIRSMDRLGSIHCILLSSMPTRYFDHSDHDLKGMDVVEKPFDLDATRNLMQGIVEDWLAALSH